MKSLLYIPKSPELRQYVQYFFLLQNEDEAFRRSFTCFPNTNYCLGINTSRLRKTGSNEFDVGFEQGQGSYLTGLYETPMTVNYAGSFRGVWINFEPLGFEMLSGEKASSEKFLEDAIESAAPSSWRGIYEICLSDQSLKTSASLLERFLLSRIPKTSPFDFTSFNLLEVTKVEDLKKIHFKSYSSINRMYQSMLGVTAKKFLEMRRFRRCINSMLTSKSLTEIAHDEDFTDQSHMIKSFRKFAGVSPKVFRKNSLSYENTLVCSVD